MMHVTKYWVMFFSPGAFFGDTWTRDYDNLPSPLEVEWPDNAYALSIHKREDIIEDDKIFKGKSEQVGKLYYHPDSKVETLEEVKKNRPSETILISNMKCNDYKRVVWSRWGNWPQPYDEERCMVLERRDDNAQ